MKKLKFYDPRLKEPFETDRYSAHSLLTVGKNPCWDLDCWKG